MKPHIEKLYCKNPVPVKPLELCKSMNHLLKCHKSKLKNRNKGSSKLFMTTI